MRLRPRDLPLLLVLAMAVPGTAAAQEPLAGPDLVVVKTGLTEARPGETFS